MAGELHLVLVADDAAGRLGRVAWILVQAGFDTLHAVLPDEAWLLARQESQRIGLMVLPAEADPADVRRVVSELPDSVRTLVVGPPPDAAKRKALGDAGAQRAVWEPYEESTLTYVVKEMIAAPRQGVPRQSARVPVNFEALLSAKGERGPAQVTALSEHGAFLATEAECAPGDAVEVEFWLPDGPVAARAIVRSVRGEEDDDANEPGLGVSFEEIDPDEAARLRTFVKDRAELLAVAGSD